MSSKSTSYVIYGGTHSRSYLETSISDSSNANISQAAVRGKVDSLIVTYEVNYVGLCAAGKATK